MDSVSVPLISMSTNEAWNTYATTLVPDAISQLDIELEKESDLIRDYFGGSEHAFNKLIREARHAGKTDDQIKLLFDLLPKLSANSHFGSAMVKLGLFDEVAYNSCSNSLLNLICQKEILLQSFSLYKTLLTRKDINLTGGIMYIRSHEDYEFYSNIAYEARLQISELDKILIRFAKQIGPTGFENLRLSQLDKDEIFGKELFTRPISDEQAKDFNKWHYVPSEITNRAEMIGIRLQRFMSKDQLLPIVEKHQLYDLTHGAFYLLINPPQKKPIPCFLV